MVQYAATPQPNQTHQTFTPWATTHFLSCWGEEAEFAGAHSKLATFLRLFTNELDKIQTCEVWSYKFDSLTDHSTLLETTCTSTIISLVQSWDNWKNYEMWCYDDKKKLNESNSEKTTWISETQKTTETTFLEEI